MKIYLLKKKNPQKLLPNRENNLILKMEEKVKTRYERSPARATAGNFLFIYFYLNFRKIQLNILSLNNEYRFGPRRQMAISKIIEIKKESLTRTFIK